MQPTDQRRLDRPESEETRLLWTLEHLLGIEVAGLDDALAEATDRIAVALGADKVDAFLYAPSIDTLVAAGTSNTPMGHRQHALGLDRLPVSNGGSAAKVFTTGEDYLTGHSEDDPNELPGIVHSLGVRSTVSTPLVVSGERRGVLMVTSATPEFFGEGDLRFLRAVAHWLGMVTNRAETVEQIASTAAEQARQVAAQELVTVLAHDLRNYLTPLKLRIDMMRRKAQREQRERDLSDIRDASNAIQRLDGLIGDLLDAGRAEQGAFAVRLDPLDLVALVRETAELQRVQPVEIVVDAPDELLVGGDRSRLQQVLENLLSNAVKHAPPDTRVEVLVREEHRDDGRRAVVIVRDNGAGIPPEVMPKLFQRFAPGPESSGLGLGLYIASRIATAHHGTLAVESLPGQGAAFRLEIPVA
jgi:two-component system OmpR family sensor kinase